MYDLNTDVARLEGQLNGSVLNCNVAPMQQSEYNWQGASVGCAAGLETWWSGPLEVGRRGYHFFGWWRLFAKFADPKLKLLYEIC